MKQNTLFTSALAAGLLSVGFGAHAATPTGDYVEARTASVFAGACHYSGEYVADGREAVMSWHFATGDWHGVSLTGLSALAVVRADNNLAETTAHRTTYLYLDASATSAQRRALNDALTSRYASVFGEVAQVKSAEITFNHVGTDGGYRVTASQIASLSVDAMPNHECCLQPNMVWYTPLAPVNNRRVGYTKMASITDKTGGDAWSRSGENSSFYGTFSF